MINVDRTKILILSNKNERLPDPIGSLSCFKTTQLQSFISKWKSFRQINYLYQHFSEQVFFIKTVSIFIPIETKNFKL
jgi:hypothetical protein